ncbi:Protein of unknown function DUF761 [Macleaya cordata]|uniref:Cotton fiber protein n=1 Tax=Macleaya cordata TaxID=56857 RepID=A0A200PWH2_MACCD|nr:Protein of unknown function DUF761 [Macleaya cordata]
MDIMDKEITSSSTKNVEKQAAPPPEHDVPKNKKKKKKKKRGLLKMIKVAIFVLRRRSTTSKQTSLWKRIVNAMGSFQDDPLHLDQHDQINPPQVPPLIIRASLDIRRPTTTQLTVDSSSSPLPKNNEVQLNIAPLAVVQDSPISPPSCRSQYASALNLQELDRTGGNNCGGEEYVNVDGCNDDDDDDMIEIYIDDDGDQMIDARAEEFIAYFYEQMKLQRLKSDLQNNRIYSMADHV